MACFFALLCKKPEKEEDDRPSHLKPDEEWLHEHLQEADAHDAQQRRINKMKQRPIGFSDEYLRQTRELRLKEKKMKSLLHEILSYLLFLALLMMVGYGNRDMYHMQLHDTLTDAFQHGNQFNGEFGDAAFSEVTSTSNKIQKLLLQL